MFRMAMSYEKKESCFEALFYAAQGSIEQKSMAMPYEKFVDSQYLTKKSACITSVRVMLEACSKN